MLLAFEHHSLASADVSDDGQTPMSVTSRDRQQQILTRVLERKYVTVRDLSAFIGVSEATVRRDLKSLADDRKLRLVHGGATVAPQTDFSFRAKEQRNIAGKRSIARAAAKLVADGEQVFLDSGTTAFELGMQLRDKQSLTIICNSARLALEVDHDPIQVIMLGGQYRPERMDTVGPIAATTLDQLRGYTAFIGVDGMSTDFGPSAVDMDSAHLYRQASGNAAKTIILADQSKFHGASLFRIVEWSSISAVVTDASPEAHWQQFFDDKGVDLHIAEPDAQADVPQNTNSDPTNTTSTHTASPTA